MGKWGRRLVVAALVLSALYFVGAIAGAAMLLNHLIVPGSVDWSGETSAAVPTDPVEIGYRGDPQVALGLPFETVSIPTPLGPAEAWRVPGSRADAPWAIYVHGIGGIRENGYRQLLALQDVGLTTLMITYRNDQGAPPSSTPLYAFGTTEWPDLDAAVTFALANGAPSVIIVAESMGGAITGQFLRHTTQRGKVLALVLDAPALQFDRVVATALARFNLPFAREIATAGIWAFDYTHGSSLATADTRAEVIGFPGPVFLAHGAGDVLVPVAVSDGIVPLRKAPTVYLRTQADHLLSYKENPARYREEMVGFLRALLP